MRQTVTRRQLGLLTFVAAAFVGIGSANAGVAFNITYDANLNAYPNLAAMKAAVNYTASEFAALYSDPITINIKVAADSDPNGLGSSLFEDPGTTYTYAQVRTALNADAKTATDTSVKNNNLPAVDPTGNKTFRIPNAEAKAIGLRPANDAALDGTFFFGTNQTYTFDQNNRKVVGAFDFIGTAEHEFSEIMGRTTQLGNAGFPLLPFDLFRFKSSARTLSATDTGVYYSIDGGATNLMSYNSVAGNDIQDWAGLNHDSFDASGPNNDATPMTTVDNTVMDSIGYDLVPEPTSLAIFAVGGIGLLARRRR